MGVPYGRSLRTNHQSNRSNTDIQEKLFRFLGCFSHCYRWEALYIILLEYSDLHWCFKFFEEVGQSNFETTFTHTVGIS